MLREATPIESGEQTARTSAENGLEQKTLLRSDVTNQEDFNRARLTDGEIVRQEAATKTKYGDRSIDIRKDLTPSDIKRLTKSQYQDVQAATRQNVSDPERLSKRRLKAYEHKFQGQLAENALAQMGGVSLNDAKGNFPVYDHLFNGETASVKTHFPNVEHENQHLAAYAHDLRVAIGATDAKRGRFAGKDGPSFAADELREFASADADFSHARTSDIHRYLVDTATLRIPSDHVDDLKTYVRRCAAQDPELYGLTKHYQTDDMNRLVERIKPVPLTEQQIRQTVEKRMAEFRSK